MAEEPAADAPDLPGLVPRSESEMEIPGLSEDPWETDEDASIGRIEADSDDENSGFIADDSDCSSVGSKVRRSRPRHDPEEEAWEKLDDWRSTLHEHFREISGGKGPLVAKALEQILVTSPTELVELFRIALGNIDQDIRRFKDIARCESDRGSAAVLNNSNSYNREKLDADEIDDADPEKRARDLDLCQWTSMPPSQPFL